MSRQKSRGWKLRIPAKMYTNEKGEKEKETREAAKANAKLN